MTGVTLDSSYLFALFCTSDVNHSHVAEHAMSDHADAIIPDIMLPEVKFLFRTAGSLYTAMEFSDVIAQSQAIITTLTNLDIRDEAISFTHYGIVALAERLEITKVYSLDPTPYLLIKPKHYNLLHVAPPVA